MEEEMNESRMRLARLTSRLAYLRTKQEEANKTEELKSNSDITDHTGTIRQIMADGNFPEDWFAYLQKVEKMGDPQTNEKLLNRLIELYNDTVAALSVEKHYANECYARILIRFAELKVFIDVDEAQEQFNLARVNCKRFAFVHIAYAQFELNRGSVRKCRTILQKALDMKAKPIELLEIAFQNLNQGKMELLLPEDGDKENLSVTVCKTTPTMLSTNIVSLNKNRKNSDSSEELQIDPFLSLRVDMSNLAKESDVALLEQMNVKQLKNTGGSKVLQAGSVPLQPIMNEAASGLKKMDGASVKMQTCTSKAMRVLTSALSQPDSCTYDLKCGSSVTSSPNLQSSNEDSEKVNDYPFFTCTGPFALKKQGAIPDQIKQEEYELKSDNLKEKRLKECKTHTVDVIKKQGSFAVEAVRGKEKSGSAFTQVSPEANGPIFNQAGVMLAPKKFPSTSGFGKSAVPTASICQTPCIKMSHRFTSSSQTPVVSKPVLAQVSTPHSFMPASQFYTSFPPTPATPQQHGDQLQQYGCSQLLPQLGISAPAFTANESIVVKERVYSIIKLLGTGGSSKVFQVLDQKKHLYAVKQVNLQDADDLAVAGYKDEIEYLKRLQQHSDKIIRLFDYEITENYIYMVMELGNVDLNTLLRRKKVIKALERKLYWENMLEAVHTIHQHGIIHSDLKPANFLVVDGMLKLIDFGIANEIQPDVTSISKDALVGTLNFMAPETIKDTFSNGENRSKSKISPKSDVWSLGCILYYMTYGKTPFQHLTNHISKLQAITDLNYEIQFPAIPEKDLLDVLKKCLIRNPKERISIAALLDHPYVHLQVQQESVEPSKTSRKEMQHILSQLVALNSPNSITRAARTLWEQCNNGHDLDVSAFMKPSRHNL
ncbi:dual specificity protein kinase Ttk [Carcharodon carcharias]|uniref:dual specificity protein kinase Ttk n=1 Tax=Carcharodon carcharias TaxID=13397 RepID=UPI001B7E298A|nr:dual specificity protein kinase Ttk [Carcharodon carcharias]XP_041043083.1 dual specificity protein kinase Ttk [Carcharodon carcharias]XP_041043084.1 dual specificity protein kinase Ttk [Carcharodon carcharias]